MSRTLLRRRALLLVAACLLAAFPLVLSTPAAAATMVKITSPLDGAVITAAQFTVNIAYSFDKLDVQAPGGGSGLITLEADAADDQQPASRIGAESVTQTSGSISFQVNRALLGKSGRWSLAARAEGPMKKDGGIWVPDAAVDRVTITYSPGPAPPQAAPTLDLLQFKESALDDKKYIEIKEGESATLRWAFRDATAAEMALETGMGTEKLGAVPVTGEKAVAPLVTTRYTLTGGNDKGTAVGIAVVRVIPRTMPPPDQVRRNLTELMGMYFSLSLRGSSEHNGPAVNLIQRQVGLMLGEKTFGSVDGVSVTVPTVANTEGGIICGDYQSGILEWLDLLRWSPRSSRLFDGLDYGPVMTLKGAHNYVVVYVAGTAWKSEGIHLDPWYFQKDASGGNIAVDILLHTGTDAFAEPDAGALGRYPLCGGQHYPTPAHQPVANPFAGKYLLNVQCPVNVLVTDQSGRQLGVKADGTAVSQIADGGYETWPEADGSRAWCFVLPPSGSYTVEMTGTGSGTMRVLCGTPGAALDYGRQFIGPGQKATLTLDAAHQAGPLVLPDGTKVTPQSLVPLTPGPAPAPEPSVNYALIIAVAAGVVVVAGVGAALRRPKARVPARASPRPAPPLARPLPPPPRPVAAASPCPACGTRNASGVKFCGRCGTALTPAPRARFCPKCGDAVALGEKFCNRCGAKLI